MNMIVHKAYSLGAFIFLSALLAQTASPATADVGARKSNDAPVPAKDAPVAADTKDWPTYNCNVLGWRHNAGETALSRANVGRLEEKWRFPPEGAGFEIGVIHA